MAISQKKVIVRTRRQEVFAGYLPLSGFVVRTGNAAVVPLLDPAGRVVEIALTDVRMICFVRDFNLADRVAPENLLRRTFIGRPRGEGLWVRVTFAEGDVLEGLAGTDRALLDGLARDDGVFLVPPDTRLNTQRVFVPREAMGGFEVLGVVGGVAVKAARVVKDGRQGGLFEGER